jgi:acyl-CoA thioester hydrolase
VSAPGGDRRAAYHHFLAIPTRWMDNDVYGHVNNVVYYSYFDTVINEYLIREGGLDIHAGEAIGFAVETACRSHRPLTFPDTIDAGLRIGRLGDSSVRYEIGLFRQGEDEPAASGHFVHVFVDRATRRPVTIPGRLRAAMERLLTAGAPAGE